MIRVTDQKRILTQHLIILYYIRSLEHGAVNKIEENQKSSERTGSSNGEVSERANTKTEKNTKKYTTNIRKTRSTGGDAMVETIYTVHQNDSEYRFQRTDNRPQYITAITPDQSLIHLGTGRVSDIGDDNNR